MEKTVAGIRIRPERRNREFVALPVKDLKAWQDQVGGYIEIVRLTIQVPWEDITPVAVVNEDGKNLGLPMNPVANGLYRTADMKITGDFFVGTVLLFGEQGGEFVDWPLMPASYVTSPI